MKAFITITAWLLIASCLKRSEIIKSEDVKSIIVAVNDNSENRDAEVSDKRSIDDILTRLNEAQRAPIKFYATHELTILYRDGKQIHALCSGSSLKVNGHTYKMKNKIGDILSRNK